MNPAYTCGEWRDGRFVRYGVNIYLTGQISYQSQIMDLEETRLIKVRILLIIKKVYVGKYYFD